jgi:hypothetical protein
VFKTIKQILRDSFAARVTQAFVSLGCEGLTLVETLADWASKSSGDFPETILWFLVNEETER